MPGKKATIADLTKMLLSAETKQEKTEQELQQMGYRQLAATARITQLTDHLAMVLRDREQLITAIALLSRRLSTPTAETDYTPSTRNYQATDPNRG